jgi:hypothetical protein
MGYTLIQVNFYLNREEITALHCVNKDKPELQCEGKCELGKRLSEAKNQTEGQTEITLKELRLVFVKQVTFEPLNPHSTVNFEFSYTPFDQLNLTNASSLDFFHPPQS